MPEIEIQHVVSCSSADKNSPAENLLKLDGSHKWKCASPGEKHVSCVLQFSKSSQIHSIDIGNEGSAFVEVLVGKATAASDQDFEVLLVASSFMSPLESRNGSNRTSVRMFSADKLNKVTSGQKWDRVKIVCTQPFSKTSQYGLSFIKFLSPPGDSDGGTKMKKLGAFTLKDEGEEDAADDLRVGSLFANRSKREASPSPVPQGAAAISKLAEQQLKTSSQTTKVPPVASASSSSPATPSSSTKKRSAESPPPSTSKAKTPKNSKQPDKGSSTEEEEIETPSKPGLKKQSTSLSSVASSTGSAANKSALKRSKTEPPNESPAKAFKSLMEKVVFVLSGFQNPYRGELRDKAIEMGAKYRPDWGRGCTHLVCAFQNTPKYQQVAGKGKIVTKSWILDCHKQKKLLPWKKYRLGDADSPDESSSEEEEERTPRPTAKPKPKAQTPGSKPQTAGSKTQPQPEPVKANKPAAKKGRGITFADSNDDEDDSGGDTEDELRKAQEKQEKKKVEDKSPSSKTETAGGKDDDDPYGVSTDDEEGGKVDAGANDEGSDSGLPELPEFFTDKNFFFYGDFDKSEQRLLRRYIAAFNGEVEEYMSKTVNYVITAQKWDDNFDDALSENPNLVFVKPKWIFVCNEKNKLMPYQPYIVVPQ